MRLDKITIGSSKASPTHQFKNLKNVTIDFAEAHWVTVVIGWNGTGKSNALEALAIIFRDLIAKKRTPEFAFKLAYRMGSGDATLRIHIDADPDRVKEPFIIYVATDAEAKGVGTLTPFIDGEPAVSPLRGKLTKLTAFLAEDAKHLPRYVFSYYSGESPRLHEVFRPYLEVYDKKLRNGEDPGLKRLFYALPVHSQFVLLAFLIQQSDVVREFLQGHLGIDPDEGIESVLFVLRKPPWKAKKTSDGDPRFWNARGVVSQFLYRLYDIALAPVDISRRVRTSLWNETVQQFKYLYVKDIDALRRLVGAQKPADFFRDLESTYVSELIEEVRIRIRLKSNDGSVTFRELSEGEQQLLTVLGLLRFTAESESLFLLDEPDTHLNPRWCVDYISYLQTFAGQESVSHENSHILLTTHNPLAIADLEKEHVQILRMDDGGEQRRVVACHPEHDPRGMGYAAIVTSDMFGIKTSLDETTYNLLERQRLLAGKANLEAYEKKDLDQINGELSRLGFRFFHPDEEYSRYLRLRRDALVAQFDSQDNDVLGTKVSDMPVEAREKLAEELIKKLMSEES